MINAPKYVLNKHQYYSFLFGCEIDMVYRPFVTLQRQDSFKNLKLYKK